MMPLSENIAQDGFLVNLEGQNDDFGCEQAAT